MRRGAPLTRRTQRGSSAYVLLLAIVVLAGMFVFSTIMSGTTGIVTEAARVEQDRAHWNAYSGALEAEGSLDGAFLDLFAGTGAADPEDRPARFVDPAISAAR